MRITRVVVDLILQSGEEFICRYQAQRYNGQLLTVEEPTYARVLPSGRVQLYSIGGGTICKEGTVDPSLLDFSGAQKQPEGM